MQRMIVADSAADVLSLSDVNFTCAPLRIITAQKEYIDNAELDVEGMVSDLETYKGRSSTSCPNANDWLEAFGDAQEVFCVTITGTLSGSYNAAVTAKQMYEDAHPDRRVFVLNSLTAGPEIALIIEKLRTLVMQDKPFDEIASQITSYSKHTGLLFMLASMKNLANNGRVNPIVAKMAGLLGIRVIGKASDKGDLEQLSKCRGESKALDAIVSYLKEFGLKAGKVRIAHCFNEEAGKALKERIQKEFQKVQIELTRCRGLCSFYAERGGLLVGFEKA